MFRRNRENFAMRTEKLRAAALWTLYCWTILSFADDPPVFTLRIKEHRFQPSELTVPAGIKFKLVVENLDETPEEFESYDLYREKIVRGGGRISLWIGPLKPGRYHFFGEFNPDTAQGALVAE